MKDIVVTQPLNVNLDGAIIDPSDDTASYHQFRVNYLKMLDWEIERQQLQLERFYVLDDKIANVRENIAEIRSDPENDGITRAERHEIHELRDDLSHLRDRIDTMPDLGVMLNRLCDHQAEFIEKSAEWDISI